MHTILGIDVGTSSVKAMLLDCTLGVVDVQSAAYDVSIPHTGWGEQDPHIWWDGLMTCLAELRQKHAQAYAAIRAIGFSGQMHGLVTVDAEGEPVRPAILWMDQRAQEECRELREKLGDEMIRSTMHNRLFSGFAFPSLVWLKKHEPDAYARIACVMQPKDYIRYRLTGILGTEVTDASATLMFDVGRRQWAWEAIDMAGLDRSMFPACHESSEVQGTVCAEAAKQTGLSCDVLVTFGMGDQQAQSIGNGAIRENMLICNIGTGGQVSAFSHRDHFDPDLRMHTFCHGVDQAYSIFGAALCSGMALKWLKRNVLNNEPYEELSALAGEIEPGSEGVIFLPYLSGERSPHMDPNASGAFYGLRLSHDRRHMIRAVMEGVVFSLKDSLALLEALGIQGERIIASGGGASSPVWLQMQADIFEKEVVVSKVSEQACLGACMIAGVGAGLFESIGAACDRFVEYDSVIYRPRKAYVPMYREGWKRFKSLYVCGTNG